MKVDRWPGRGRRCPDADVGRVTVEGCHRVGERKDNFGRDVPGALARHVVTCIPGRCGPVCRFTDSWPVRCCRVPDCEISFPTPLVVGRALGGVTSARHVPVAGAIWQPAAVGDLVVAYEPVAVAEYD